MCARANPHTVNEPHFQHKFAVNVCGGIFGDMRIGPHMFPAGPAGELYLRFLLEDLPLLVEYAPLAIRRQMRYMYDGAQQISATLSEIACMRNNHTDVFDEGDQWHGHQGLQTSTLWTCMCRYT